MGSFVYNVSLNGQIIGARTSAAQRVYTHAVAVVGLPEDTSRWYPGIDPARREELVAIEKAKIPYILTWCGSLALAMKSPDSRRWQKNGYKTEIVPVTRIK